MAKKRTRHKTIRALVNDIAEQMQKLVRLKAADENGYVNCVTCSTVDHWTQMDGGHYIKREKRKHVLLEENIHPQCRKCNRFLGGNDSKYTLYMIDMYGRDFVDWLHATASEVVKEFRPDLEDKLFEVKAQVRELETG